MSLPFARSPSSLSLSLLRARSLTHMHTRTHVRTRTRTRTHAHTQGLHRWNMQWLDVFRHIHTKSRHTKTKFKRTQALLEIYAEAPRGLHMQESVPGWLLACYGRFECSEETKDKNYQQLKYLFGIHMYGNFSTGLFALPDRPLFSPSFLFSLTFQSDTSGYRDCVKRLLTCGLEGLQRCAYYEFRN